MMETIEQTIEALHSALKDYIEATYHIASPALIMQRKHLLDRPQTIRQYPYLESTPRYVAGERFENIKGLSPAAKEAFLTLTKAEGDAPRVLFNPPYKHQAQAIEANLVDGKNLVIMTGTGSGKTESFLLPILGKLATEAGAHPNSFAQPAMRALLLYPMNALVNDQLGRLRAIFGDPRLVHLFQTWAGRPARFARYTSRTPYAGVRDDTRKDHSKLHAFEEFYVAIQRAAQSGGTPQLRQRAENLKRELKRRGKWPAKPDLVAWYGEPNTPWRERRTGRFIRAVTLPDDSELLTRHEVQTNPPDLLVTNYSMLEYMLMRPIERSIFDATRDWLGRFPNESFLVVIDEAHLYRGSSGAEVGLLLRRLRDRLQIPVDRFRVICATASFSNPAYGKEFSAELSGTSSESFVPITGSLDLKSDASAGDEKDTAILSSLDIGAFYEAVENDARAAPVLSLLNYRGVTKSDDIERDLYAALKDFGPLGLLINTTMKRAMPLSALAEQIFPRSEERVAKQALTALLAVASVARPEREAAGLLPCRIHNFFRGLPGLWVCLDPNCTELGDDERSGICGKLYGQPIERCGCGSRVLEFFTCRFCGTAYGRGYTDDVDRPTTLWSLPGERMRVDGMETSALLPLDLLLEEPESHHPVEPADLELETARLNAPPGTRQRRVYLRQDRVTPAADEEGEVDTSAAARGQFIPCACCGKQARFGRSNVQDHQTKGDQPFQALVARQIKIQPPSAVEASRFAPLRGRKVLVFSDSRQVAARLAPNLQMYSTRDSLRPLIVWGMRRLQTFPGVRALLSLEDLFLAVLLGGNELGVRLRPELGLGETFQAEDTVALARSKVQTSTDSDLIPLLARIRTARPPQSLLDDIIKTVQDPFLGLEALALASLVEVDPVSEAILGLPDIQGLAATDEAKLGLARAWLRCWRNNGFWLNQMPNAWWRRPRSEGVSVKGQRSRFEAMNNVILDRTARRAFKDHWADELFRLFCESVNNEWRLLGSNLSLKFDGPWVRCDTCKSVHRPVPGLTHCLDCASPHVVTLDPFADPAFVARKGYYRNPTLRALATPPEPPMAIVAAEHTAQLNAPQTEDVFSTAEKHELLFQDISPSLEVNRDTAIDVLSSTTTMEVGIDIGALSGVALRNMPPARANYQQRAGRAGRRGNAVATVIAFGSADSHDEHYFENPEAMIAGDVVDPRLTLENPDIARRHIRAFLLQNYHQERLPRFDPSQRADLFSVLGTVESFRTPGTPLNSNDFRAWLAANASALRQRIEDWIPIQLSDRDRNALLDEFAEDAIKHIDDAIHDDQTPIQARSDDDEEDETPEEDDPRPNAGLLAGNLLDRLLYCGVLPRYAFPTDVASFHIFDLARSSHFRPVMKFAPSQGLPIALSQYAPGKQIWVAGKSYSSGALYSVMSNERFEAWNLRRRVYRECSACGYAYTSGVDSIPIGDAGECPACGESQTFGPARHWIRPPGFAHPVDVPEVTSPDDMPETSYATRAKLVMSSPPDETRWTIVNPRISVLSDRPFLLVSNTGPSREGYTYCTRCGRIEATTEQSPALFNPHRKPYVDDREPMCDAGATARNIVLGTDFVTDIALFSLAVDDPVRLRPGAFSTDVALRTLSEALAKAACQMLEVEPSELMAEYRPALTKTSEGRDGLKTEIFLYDTLAGGAGFSSQLVGRGKQLFERALHILEHCPEDCDVSCYRCLRSFKNKFEHALLDRHVGSQLLRYLLTGTLPSFQERRTRMAAQLLFDDLRRQSLAGVTLKFEEEVTLQGGRRLRAPIVAESGGTFSIIAPSGPLTENYPADSALLAARGSVPIHFVNELIIRGNLASAVRLARAGLED